jgi:hypothetical protein
MDFYLSSLHVDGGGGEESAACSIFFFFFFIFFWWRYATLFTFIFFHTIHFRTWLDHITIYDEA